MPQRRALSYALKLLSYRDRSVKEMEERLKRRGFSEEAVDETISQLKKLGYLDDRRTARNLIDWLCEERPQGRCRLRWELERRLYDPEVIEELLDELFSRISETELAEKCLERYLKRTSLSGEPKKVLVRIKRYLAYRGFSASTIYRAVRQADLPPEIRCYLDT